MDARKQHSWKKKFGRIFSLQLEGQEVYFRLLSCNELMHLEDHKEEAPSVIPDLVILNDVKLTLPGSRVYLSEFVLKESLISDEDDLQKRIIENRLAVDNHFYLRLVTEICSVFVSYTPDELMDKTADQLLRLTAIVEKVTGKQLILREAGKKRPPTAMPTLRTDESWGKPPIDELMNESTEALKRELAKHGKKAQTIKEKKQEAIKDLDPVAKQMHELNDFIKTIYG